MLSEFIKINIRQALNLINNMQLGLRMARERKALGKLTNAQHLNVGRTPYKVKIEVAKTYRIPKNHTSNG